MWILLPQLQQFWGTPWLKFMKVSTRAVRDCLIRPYARISEYLVIYLCIGHECKVGHSDFIPEKRELSISSNEYSITLILKLKSLKEYGQQDENQGIESLAIWACVPNLENLSWFARLWMQSMTIPMSPLKCFGKGQNNSQIKVILGYLGKMSPGQTY